MAHFEMPVDKKKHIRLIAGIAPGFLRQNMDILKIRQRDQEMRPLGII